MENYEWLKYYTKCFVCDGNNIDILKNPTHFYSVLKEKIKTSNKRIIWSSLYLGTGKMEKELVELLLERFQAHKVTKKDRTLTFLCLIDYLRGSRPVTNVHRRSFFEDGHSSTDVSNGKFGSSGRIPSHSPGYDDELDSGYAGGSPARFKPLEDFSSFPSSKDVIRIPPKFFIDDEDTAKRARYSSVIVTFPSLMSNKTITSRDLLLPLIKRYPENASVYLYQSPKFNTLNKLLLPGALKEIAGLNHVKAYIFDDDVIISGANLSETYFTNRQDRYILIKDCKELCDHLEIFIRLLCKFSSHRLLPDDTTFDMIKLSRQISKRRRKSFKKYEDDIDEIDMDDHDMEGEEKEELLDNHDPNTPLKGTFSTRYKTEENQYYMNNFYGKQSELGYKIRQLFGGYKFDRWMRHELLTQRRTSQSSREISIRRWSLLPFIEKNGASNNNKDGQENCLLEHEYSYGSTCTQKPSSQNPPSPGNPEFLTDFTQNTSNNNNNANNNTNNQTTPDQSLKLSFKRGSPNPLSSVFSKIDPPNRSSHALETQDETTRNNAPTKPAKKFDTYIYPLIQAKPHGVDDDHACMVNFFNSIDSGSRLWLASGYFNLVPDYTDILLNRGNMAKDEIESKNFRKYKEMSAKSQLLNPTTPLHNYRHPKTLNSFPAHEKALYAANILLASPQANGFYGSKGCKKYIPLIYLYATELFYDKLQSSRLTASSNRENRSRRSLIKNGNNNAEDESSYTNSDQIILWEYNRKEWTYHSKGLWIYPLLDRFPNFTIFGSSNFGYRSVYRDVELQVAMFTTNPNLKQKLHKELDDIIGHTSKVSEITFQGKDRKIPLWLKLFFKIMKPYF